MQRKETIEKYFFSLEKLFGEIYFVLLILLKYICDIKYIQDVEGLSELLKISMLKGK